MLVLSRNIIPHQSLTKDDSQLTNLLCLHGQVKVTAHHFEVDSFELMLKTWGTVYLRISLKQIIKYLMRLLVFVQSFSLCIIAVNIYSK